MACNNATQLSDKLIFLQLGSRTLKKNSNWNSFTFHKTKSKPIHTKTHQYQNLGRSDKIKCLLYMATQTPSFNINDNL